MGWGVGPRRSQEGWGLYRHFWGKLGAGVSVPGGESQHGTWGLAHTQTGFPPELRGPSRVAWAPPGAEEARSSSAARPL